jgi:hypothetical protein
MGRAKKPVSGFVPGSGLLRLSFSLAQEINASDSLGRSPDLWLGFARGPRAFSSFCSMASAQTLRQIQ